MLLGRWGSARVARALVAAARAGERGRPASAAPPTLMVIGRELARAVGRSHPRAAVRVIDEREPGPPTTSAEGASAEAVLASIVSTQGLAARLSRWAEAVGDGGLVAVASPASALLQRPIPAEALTEAFVHAALVDVEQRSAGRTRLTLGRVRRAARPPPTLR